MSAGKALDKYAVLAESLVLKTSARYLLILVMAGDRVAFDDLYEIGQEILRQADDIAIHIATPRDTSDSIPESKWKLPALTVGLSPLHRFTPPRGRIFAARPVKKLDQHARFLSCGIDTPRSERFEFGKPYRENDWGEFCVLKPLPLDLTSKGNIQLIRTRRLAAIRGADFPPKHFLNCGPALVQRFIDTGENASYNRVMTLFGEPLLWWRGFSPIARPPLSASDAEIERAIIEPKDDVVRANFEVKLRRLLEVEPEIVAFARRMHEAYPDIPLKGCDVLKEHSTGRLYAIEINGGGNVWHFSSQMFSRSRAQMGGREAMLSHYNPWPPAARILIEMTRTHAA